MRSAFEIVPNGGPPEQLMLLLHGWGAGGASLRALADSLADAFPRAALVAPDAPHAVDDRRDGFEWFSVRDIDDARRVQRVADVVPVVAEWVYRTQQRLGAGPVATAIAGFSQGAIVALELAQRHDGLAGRVLSFAGRYARLPERAPQRTTLHLLHGSADAVVDVAHARLALRHLGVLHGDATLDVAEGVGHELHPALVDRALQRLQGHIPHRTWRAALGAVQDRKSVV